MITRRKIASSIQGELFVPKSYHDILDMLNNEQKQIYNNVLFGGASVTKNRGILAFEGFEAVPIKNTSQVHRYLLIDSVHYNFGVLDPNKQVKHLGKAIKNEILQEFHKAEITSKAISSAIQSAYTNSSKDKRGYIHHNLENVINLCIEHKISLHRVYWSYHRSKSKGTLFSGTIRGTIIP